MPNILSLSAEMILQVGDSLGDRALAHFAQGNRYLRQVLSGMLRERAFQEKPARVVNIPALVWAIDYGHSALVRAIVTEPGFSRHDSKIRNALHEAAKLGNSTIITTLLEAGYPVNARKHGGEPLHLSAMNGHAAAVKLLLENGANVKAKNKKNKTAFELAIASPQQIFKSHRKSAPGKLSRHDELQLRTKIVSQVVATLQVLVAHGAHNQISIADEDGNTPLHQAVSGCLATPLDLSVGTGVLEFLVQQGARVSARNKDDDTPMDLAALYETANITSLNFFLNLGGDPNSTDSLGQSLLSNAIYRTPESLPMVEFLLKRGARAEEVDLVGFFAVMEETDPVWFDKMLNLLLIYGASFGKEAWKCFTLAAIHGSLDGMKAVFAAGRVDINVYIRENTGAHREGTPLELAIKMGRVDMVEFLVAKGVRISDEQIIQVEGILGIAVHA